MKRAGREGRVKEIEQERETVKEARDTLAAASMSSRQLLLKVGGLRPGDEESYLYSLFTFEMLHNLYLERSKIPEEWPTTNFLSEALFDDAKNEKWEQKPVAHIRMLLFQSANLSCLHLKGEPKNLC